MATTLSDNAIGGYAAQGGFSGGGLVMAIAIALAESGGNPQAAGYNRNSAGTVTSVDRGLWQINNYWHSEVSDSCAYDPRCAAGAAYRISAAGTNWQPWSTYQSGAYKQYLQRAQAAASANTKGQGNQPGNINTGQLPPPPGVGSTGTPGMHSLTMADLVSGNTGTVETQTESLGSPTEDLMAGYRTIVALVVMFGFLYVVSKTRAGYAAIYLGQLLILFFLFATQSQFFKQALIPLAPHQAETPQSPPSQSQSAAL